jgi:hypothetical protein
MDKKTHWQQVYQSRREEQMSWFQARPELSLQLIRDTHLPLHSAILDVGGGASRLVDCLLDAGYSEIAVLDIADAGLTVARRRLTARAARVQWIVSDVTRYRPTCSWDLWHDRAVFHFLVEAAERERYRQTLEHAVASRGHVILATFGPQGPERCSGLPVVRYGATELGAELGAAFELRRIVTEQHSTPSGAVQEFQYSWFQRTG